MAKYLHLIGLYSKRNPNSVERYNPPNREQMHVRACVDLSHFAEDNAAMTEIRTTTANMRMSKRKHMISPPMDPNERKPDVLVAESFSFQVRSMITITMIQRMHGPHVETIRRITGMTATPGIGMKAQMIVRSQSGTVRMTQTNEITYNTIEVMRAHGIWLIFG